MLRVATRCSGLVWGSSSTIHSHYCGCPWVAVAQIVNSKAWGRAALVHRAMTFEAVAFGCDQVLWSSRGFSSTIHSHYCECPWVAVAQIVNSKAWGKAALVHRAMTFKAVAFGCKSTHGLLKHG